MVTSDFFSEKIAEPNLFGLDMIMQAKIFIAISRLWDFLREIIPIPKSLCINNRVILMFLPPKDVELPKGESTDADEVAPLLPNHCGTEGLPLQLLIC